MQRTLTTTSTIDKLNIAVSKAGQAYTATSSTLAAPFKTTNPEPYGEVFSAAVIGLVALKELCSGNLYSAALLMASDLYVGAIAINHLGGVDAARKSSAKTAQSIWKFFTTAEVAKSPFNAPEAKTDNAESLTEPEIVSENKKTM
jgi:hypothetical protein